MKIYTVICGVLLSLSYTLYVSEACNESICVSKVSKCMLLKACDCDMTDKKNCSCCKDCQKCLSKLYTDCCSCVGLCKAPNPEEDLLDTSSVENLPDAIPELFEVLTEEPDMEKRWLSFSYPVHYDALIYKPGHGILDLSTDTRDKDKMDDFIGSEQNCTVAFMSPCLSLRKCKDACLSMGAARYRWFHDDGCCQCIGSTCINYGKNSPHCLSCPPKDDQMTVDDSDTAIDMVNNLPLDDDDDDDVDDDDDDDDDDLDDNNLDDVNERDDNV